MPKRNVSQNRTKLQIPCSAKLELYDAAFRRLTALKLEESGFPMYCEARCRRPMSRLPSILVSCFSRLFLVPLLVPGTLTSIYTIVPCSQQISLAFPWPSFKPLWFGFFVHGFRWSAIFPCILSTRERVSFRIGIVQFVRAGLQRIPGLHGAPSSDDPKLFWIDDKKYGSQLPLLMLAQLSLWLCFLN